MFFKEEKAGHRERVPHGEATMVNVHCKYL